MSGVIPAVAAAAANTLAALALVYLAASLVAGTVAFALAFAIVRWWKPLDASARYAVWFGALLVVALGPLLSVVPASQAMPSATVRTHTALFVPRPGTAAVVPQPGPRPARLVAVPPAIAFSLLGAWLLVVLIGAARFTAGAFALRRLRRDALPVPLDVRDRLPLWQAYRDARTRLCVSDRIDVPVAVGLADRAVVIPERVLASFDAGDVDRFVLHELAHLARRDDWTTAAQRALQILLFFNPVVHALARRLDLEREIACDDRVVAATRDVRSYAIGLTRMAESAAWPQRGVPTPAIFISRTQLSMRVEELLGRRDPAPHRLATIPAAAGLVVALGAFAVAGTAVPPLHVGDAHASKMRVLVFVTRGKGPFIENKDAEVVVIHGDEKLGEKFRARRPTSRDALDVFLRTLKDK